MHYVTDEIRMTKEEVLQQGFAVINSIYTDAEIESILSAIAKADTTLPVFRKTQDLFAIRQFLKEIPAVKNLVFNSKLKATISQVFGSDNFLIKSIYFDKPEHSNWFVSYHQDLTISVNKKIDLQGFTNWTVKQDQFSVQPPPQVLQNNFTIRIHLDNTDEKNGALRVIAGSHLKGVYRPETIDWTQETETMCRIAKGGIMIMKPLLLHASGRTVNNQRRRVIHLEFSSCSLPGDLQWSERVDCKQ